MGTETPKSRLLYATTGTKDKIKLENTLRDILLYPEAAIVKFEENDDSPRALLITSDSILYISLGDTYSYWILSAKETVQHFSDEHDKK